MSPKNLLVLVLILLNYYCQSQSCQEAKSVVVEYENKTQNEIMAEYRSAIYKTHLCGIDSLSLSIFIQGQLSKQTVDQARKNNAVLTIGDLVPIDMLQMMTNAFTPDMPLENELSNALFLWNKLHSHRNDKVSKLNWDKMKSEIKSKFPESDLSEIESLVESGMYDGKLFSNLLDDWELKIIEQKSYW